LIGVVDMAGVGVDSLTTIYLQKLVLLELHYLEPKYLGIQALLPAIAFNIHVTQRMSYQSFIYAATLHPTPPTTVRASTSVSTTRNRLPAFSSSILSTLAGSIATTNLPSATKRKISS